MNSLSEIEKDFEWVGTVTNLNYEYNYQVGIIGYVAKKYKIKGDVIEQGYPTIMVGYADIWQCDRIKCTILILSKSF